MNKLLENRIESLLNIDPLLSAEEITGKSYKDDKLTSLIGLMENMRLNEIKNNTLSIADDTCFTETEDEYKRKATDYGFETLLCLPFINEHGIEEREYIMFHRELSILLHWDTFTWNDDGSWAKSGKQVPPPSRNGGKFYYNYAFSTNCNRHTESGSCVSHSNKTFGHLYNKDFTPHYLPEDLLLEEPHWTCEEKTWDDYNIKNKIWNKKCNDYIKEHDLIYIWSGDHDCREALKFHINKLRENGTFCKQWVEPPFLWLLNYMESKSDVDYVSINKKKIQMLPMDIQKIINYNK